MTITGPVCRRQIQRPNRIIAFIIQLLFFTKAQSEYLLPRDGIFDHRHPGTERHINLVKKLRCGIRTHLTLISNYICDPQSLLCQIRNKERPGQYRQQSQQIHFVMKPNRTHYTISFWLMALIQPLREIMWSSLTTSLSRPPWLLSVSIHVGGN